MLLCILFAHLKLNRKYFVNEHNYCLYSLISILDLMYLGFFIAAKLKIAARILIYVSLVKKISWGICINLIS